MLVEMRLDTLNHAIRLLARQSRGVMTHDLRVAVQRGERFQVGGAPAAQKEARSPELRSCDPRSQTAIPLMRSISALCQLYKTP